MDMVRSRLVKAAGIRLRRVQKKTLLIVLVLLVPLSTWAAGDTTMGQTSDSRPLPPELRTLPAIVAEPWLQLDSEIIGAGGLEGPAFDREGNLYVCRCSPDSKENKILRISADKKISVLWKGKAIPNSLAFHKDGRLFAVCQTGELLIMNPDGSSLHKVTPTYLSKDISSSTLEGIRRVYPTYTGKTLKLNDLVFDDAGNLYVTDGRGTIANPSGGVYKLAASYKYQIATAVMLNLANPSGISLSPSKDALWVAETSRNVILRIELTQDGYIAPIGGLTRVYSNTGDDAPEANTVDSQGNLYQAMQKGGRVLVLNKHGVPVANVLVPGRDESRNLMTASLAIKKGTDEGYLMIAGQKGESSWIYLFKTLARADVTEAQQ